MKELWKEIKEASNYEVSSKGRVRSKDRYVKCISKNQHTNFKIIKFFKSQIIKPIFNKGYLRVGIQATRKKRIHRAIHRLVAIAFIPNPKNKPQVNHINGVKISNNVTNLEWSTAKENVQHAITLGIGSNGGAKKVIQYDLKGKQIAIYSSTTEVQRKLNISQQDISAICLGGRGRKSAGKFRWRYTNSLPLDLTTRIGTAKKTVQYDLNGNKLNVYSSASEASRKTEINYTSISLVCRGIYKTAGGFKWGYA